MTAKIIEIKGKDETGKDWSGKYPFVSADARWVRAKVDGKVYKFPRSWASKLPASASMALSYEELVAQIRDRFEALEELTGDIIKADIRALIVSGAPGVGKTFSIEAQLKGAKLEGRITKYTKVTGTASPIGLFTLLWKHRGEGDVLLLDDADGALANEDAVNMLKAALDTTKTRHISYIKEASALKEQGIPQRFEYKGRVIFISNQDFDALIASGSKLSQHLRALTDRSMYLDTGLHSVQALLARVEQVCRETAMLRDLGLTEEQIEETVMWIKDNAPNLRSISLRTAMNLGVQVKKGHNWKLRAKTLFLKAAR